MANEFSEFVAKTIEVLEEKKTTFLHKQILPFNPQIVIDTPLICVEFTSAIPERINEQQLQYELHADIWYYYARFDAGLKKTELDDILSEMVIWLLRNQDLKGFTLRNWVTEVGFTVENISNAQIATGRIHLVAIKYGVEIPWVGLP